MYSDLKKSCNAIIKAEITHFLRHQKLSSEVFRPYLSKRSARSSREPKKFTESSDSPFSNDGCIVAARF